MKQTTDISTQPPSSLRESIALLLGNELAKKQRTNPQYSLRSFARDLEMHPGSLSAIIKGKRLLPESKLLPILQRLKFSPDKIDELLRCRKPSTTLLEDIHYTTVISEWEHYAFLTLLDSMHFRFDIPWLAKKLGVDQNRVTAVIENLEKCGLVSIKDEKITAHFSNLRTSEDVISSALKAAHTEELHLAKIALEELSPSERDFSSRSFLMPKDKLPLAKELIRKFRSEINSLCEGNESEDVYNLCIQFFPLTKVQNGGHDPHETKPIH